MLRRSLKFAALAAAFQGQTALAGLLDILHVAPTGWLEASEPADAHPITLQIGLKQQNTDEMISRLHAVSTPGNEAYGQHLDRDEVNALIQPTDEANEAVQSWLASEGVTDVHSDGHWVTFSTTVATANKLLNTTFKHYTKSGVQKLRTTQYSVPDDIHDHVDLIWPTTFFGKTQGHAPTHLPKRTMDAATAAALARSCSSAISPSCLKQLYGAGNYSALASSGSEIGFGSFINQSARYQDLQLYETYFSLPNQTFSVELINGGTNGQDLDGNHGEANLDVQAIVGVANPLPVTEYITGGSPPFIPNLDEPTAADNSNEPYLPYYQYLLNRTNDELPQVITNSYGDDEQTVPIAYATRVCNMIAQLGLRGITVIESSGDTGIGGPCQSNDGNKTAQFTPIFPGTCPYITAVGGTQAINPEIAWVSSSGGFSNYFARPSYQNSTVETYLNEYISAETLDYYQPYFNQSGRAFPDVAAHSLAPYYYVFDENSPTQSGGTSAAAPVFAAIVALLNDARLRAGKSALGFLNPWLYSDGYNYLTDVTSGASKGCNGVNGQTGVAYNDSGVIPYARWNATVGWDPVTGLGTPNFTQLLDAVLKLD